MTVVIQVVAEAGLHERAKTAPLRAGHGHDILLEEMSKETLGQISGAVLFIAEMADQGINGIPITYAKCGEGGIRIRIPCVSGGQDKTPLGSGKQSLFLP
jgi:hypothetical protein